VEAIVPRRRLSGPARGAGVAPLCQRRRSGIARSTPRKLRGDAYFTDGLRAVAGVSSRRIRASEVNYIGWEPLPNQ
jgi:hypothetical protein